MTTIVAEPIVEQPPVELNEQNVLDKVSSLLEIVSTLSKTIREVETEIKQIKNAYIKEQRQNKKKMKKKRVNSSRKNGFLGATSISQELTQFLGLEKDTQVVRPDVTKAIAKYIKENNLAVPENKSIFKPDAKLLSLLGEPVFPLKKKQPELGNGYTYFNLQSYLKKMNHFVV